MTIPTNQDYELFRIWDSCELEDFEENTHEYGFKFDSVNSEEQTGVMMMLSLTYQVMWIFNTSTLLYKLSLKSIIYIYIRIICIWTHCFSPTPLPLPGSPCLRRTRPLLLWCWPILPSRMVKAVAGMLAMSHRKLNPKRNPRRKFRWTERLLVQCRGCQAKSQTSGACWRSLTTLSCSLDMFNMIWTILSNTTILFYTCIF